MDKKAVPAPCSMRRAVVGLLRSLADTAKASQPGFDARGTDSRTDLIRMRSVVQVHRGPFS